ncbi:hypothetical protein [Streptomyces qinzhouensis]|nr:hypothetical protein [Streptomyces qinzhouensis]
MCRHIRHVPVAGRGRVGAIGVVDEVLKLGVDEVNGALSDD